MAHIEYCNIKTIGRKNIFAPRNLPIKDPEVFQVIIKKSSFVTNLNFI